MSNILKTNASIPVSPRTKIYFPDGNGRDSYIFTNNGGLSKSGLRIMGSNETQNNFNGTRFANLGRSPGPIRYFCNGSGRDTYVNFNSGGFQKVLNVSGDLKLNHIVRNPEFKISPNLPEYNNSPKKINSPFKTKKEIDATKGLRMLENSIINRLYYNNNNNNKSISFRSINPQSTKNSAILFSPVNTRENFEENDSNKNTKSNFINNINTVNINDLKKTSKIHTKIDFADFNAYLEKLANYESKKNTLKKY